MMLRFFLIIVCLFALPVHAFETKAKQAIVIDHATQTVLFAKHSDTKMYPSSMSKLMTLYILFEKLQSGAITLDTTFPVSEKAWKKGGSKMFVKVGTEIRVEDLIRGIVVQSGNDACIVVAEALGGSEDGFVRMMNDKAAEMRFTGSRFANATGWPDENHYMTAHELAWLSYLLVENFPDYYPYFAEETYTYSGITQPNRNRLLGKGLGIDGLKTGHTEVAGYGIVVSAMDEATGRRVHVVVNGLGSEQERLEEARRLADYGLREFTQVTLGQGGAPLAELPVWLGAEDSVPLVLEQPKAITLPRDRGRVKFVLKAGSPVGAPVAKGMPLAELHVMEGDQQLASLLLVAGKTIEDAYLIERFWHNLKAMLAAEE